MALNDIYINGKLPEPMTGKQMCEIICNAGLIKYKPEELWNYSSTGELGYVFDLYFLARHVMGDTVAMEDSDGELIQLYGDSQWQMKL